MNLVETVEALCEIVQAQSKIISRQALLLAESDCIMDSVKEELHDEIVLLERRYSGLVGED